MTDNNDNKSFAKKFKNLFHEAPSSFQESPIYSELSELTKRYVNPEHIASGGMKSIKRVLDLATSRKVAFAELRDSVDESLYEIFLREARLTALLEHPNIINIHDIGLKENGTPYFTMDLKEGDNLADIFQKLELEQDFYINTYSLHQLLIIFIKICDAIAYAHSKNFIHLDLKPENIQVGSFGEVLVCDWGLGKILSANETEDLEELLLDADLLNHVTSKNSIVGTPGYMAPEQIKKDGEHDKRSDIYSLGCVLYSILTYKRPLDGNVNEILKNTLLGNIVPPHLRSSQDVPLGLQAVVKRAMEVNPDQRYQTVLELKNDVQKFLEGYSTEAENSNIFREVKLFIKRNKAASSITFLGLIIICLLSVFFIQALKKEVLETHKASQQAKASAAQYKQERNKANELLDNLTTHFLKESELASKTFVYQYPERSLKRTIYNSKKILQLIPDHNRAQHHLLLSLFMMQRFNEIDALPYNNLPSIKNLSRKYAPLLKNQADKLSVTDLRDLIRDIVKLFKYKYPVAERILAYASHKKNHKTDFFPVVSEILKIINPHWNGEGFTYDRSRQHLSISSKNILYLKGITYPGSGHSIIRFLRLRSLSLTGSKINDLTHLESLELESLDLRGSSITDLSKLYKLKKVGEIIISKGQFSEAQINAMPKTITLSVQ
jgi:serine/threonine protein kinase